MDKQIRKNLEDALYTKKSGYGIWHGIAYIIGCTISIISGGIIGSFMIQYDELVLGEIFIKGGVYTSLFTGLGFLWIAETLIEKKVKKILSAEKLIEKLGSKSLKKTQNIDETLEISTQLYIALSEIQYVSRFKKKKIFQKYLDECFEKVRKILIDQKNDLQNEFFTRQAELAQAYENIKYQSVQIPKHEDILSLQSSRLEYQITKFERLQKVLLEI